MKVYVRREFAARVGADAYKSQADLQAVQQQKGQMVITNTKLSQVRQPRLLMQCYIEGTVRGFLVGAMLIVLHGYTMPLAG